ncbi:MAG TPA: hypothetical protein VEC06_18380 [Paucimonas sp.]|nr:hypothetical protein [Paucimonas sp.]
MACLLAWCWAKPALGEPYIPVSDAQVLERLPFRPNDPLVREMARLRQELRHDPHNEDLAVRLARRYYSLVAQEGDPRYLGYAQAALTPWWDMPVPPIEVQVLRASLRQFRHDFGGALTDLEQVLQRSPAHVQARILRATIHIVQARYADAKVDCKALHGFAGQLLAIGCEQTVEGLTGNAAGAYRILREALSAYPKATADAKLWASVRLAELAQRLGRAETAEMHFRQGLSLGITDTFLFAAYADFLLDQQRPAEVVELLKNKARSDNLLLRLVLAERKLNLPEAMAKQTALAARYAAAQLRGDTVHQQEEARFALEVQGDPKKALDLARENWKVQREPRDARIFLEAALAAKEPRAAQPVLEWLERSRIEDRYLRALGAQVKGMRQ